MQFKEAVQEECCCSCNVVCFIAVMKCVWWLWLGRRWRRHHHWSEQIRRWYLSLLWQIDLRFSIRNVSFTSQSLGQVGGNCSPIWLPLVKQNQSLCEVETFLYKVVKCPSVKPFCWELRVILLETAVMCMSHKHSAVKFVVAFLSLKMWELCRNDPMYEGLTRTLALKFERSVLHGRLFSRFWAQLCFIWQWTYNPQHFSFNLENESARHW